MKKTVNMKLKVLWIAPIRHPKNIAGHPAPWIEELAKNLSAEIDLTILGGASDNIKQVETFHYDNITRVYLKTVKSLVDIATLKLYNLYIFRKWIKKNFNKYDLIHIHGNEHQYEIACKNFKIPKVISMQGIISEYLKYYKPSGLKKLSWSIASYLELKGYKTVNNYSCRTNWDKSIVLNHNIRAQIFNIWETIRPQFFDYSKKRKGNDIVFIGGSNPIKRLDSALIAFDIIKRDRDLNLLVIGNTSVEYINSVIVNNNLNIGLNKDVKILGFQDADGIIESFKNAFCLLHPSLIDNSPNSICEAQICGLPVVATNVGGVLTLIEDGVTGLLTDSNPDFIAKQLLKLYDDDLLWSTISNNSSLASRERHNPNTIVENTLKMYKDIIKGNDE